MHDLLLIGVPLIAIFAGILFNRSDVRELRAEMLGRFGDMSGRFDRSDALANSRHSEILGRFNVLESDMRQFYHLTGKLESRMDAIEKR